MTLKNKNEISILLSLVIPNLKIRKLIKIKKTEAENNMKKNDNIYKQRRSKFFFIRWEMEGE